MKKLIVLTLALSASAFAVTVNVTINNCGAIPGTSSTGDCGTMATEIRNEINDKLPDVSIDKYADGIADSTGFVQNGQTSEYGRDFNLFMVKASAGIAVKGDINDVESAEGVAVGGSVGAMINMGILPISKLGFINFSKLDLGFSFLSYKMDQDAGEASFDGEISSLNIMARYRLVDAVDIVPGNLVRWEGVHLHTGLQRASMKLDLVQDFKDETVNSGIYTATFQNGKASFGIDSKTTVIPIEVSTAIRLGYILSFYTGLGLDYVSGSTDIDFDASGDLTAVGGFDASIDAGQSGDGSPVAMNKRMFAGLQINVPIVSLFIHANKGLGNDLLGVNAGLKAYW